MTPTHDHTTTRAVQPADSLPGFMQQLAGPASTFSGTFGIIIPAGTATGTLLGWAEYQRRIGPGTRQSHELRL